MVLAGTDVACLVAGCCRRRFGCSAGLSIPFGCSGLGAGAVAAGAATAFLVVSADLTGLTALEPFTSIGSEDIRDTLCAAGATGAG